MKSRESVIKSASIIAFSALLTVSIIIAAKGWVGGHFTSVESLRAYVASFGVLAPIILALIQMMQVILPVLPGFMGSIVGALLFGAVGGFWVNYIGISAGSIAAYWLARCFGIKLVNKMVPVKKYETFIERVNRSKSYTLVLFLAILLPLAPDDFFCYFSGIIKMSSKKFTAIIIAAKPWCLLFYSIFFTYII